MKILAGFFKAIFWILIITGVVSGTAFGVYLYKLSKTLPQNLEDELHKRNDVLPTVLYDREGNQIFELFIRNYNSSLNKQFINLISFTIIQNSR